MFASFMQYSPSYECLFTAADRWHRKHRKTYKRTDLAPISDQAFWARIRLISEPNTGVLQLSHHWLNLQFASIHHYRLSISQKYFDAAAVIHTVNITIGVVYVCEKSTGAFFSSQSFSFLPPSSDWSSAKLSWVRTRTHSHISKVGGSVTRV